MEDSILVTIKKMLGIHEDDTAFDVDIITLINATLLTLTQLGVGVDGGLTISDENSIWSDFLEDSSLLGMVKGYIYCKVRLVFDTPTSSAMADALNKAAAEYEWRLNVQVDPGEET